MFTMVNTSSSICELPLLSILILDMMFLFQIIKMICKELMIVLVVAISMQCVLGQMGPGTGAQATAAQATAAGPASLNPQQMMMLKAMASRKMGKKY